MSRDGRAVIIDYLSADCDAAAAETLGVAEMRECLFCSVALRAPRTHSAATAAAVSGW